MFTAQFAAKERTDIMVRLEVEPLAVARRGPHSYDTRNGPSGSNSLDNWSGMVSRPMNQPVYFRLVLPTLFSYPRHFISLQPHRDMAVGHG